MFCKSQSSNGSHQPKSDEVESWSGGLDRLLDSRYGTALFRAFLQREHAEENLDFILKVDKYKNMDNLARRQRMAWDLYRDYIAVGAKHELNLDSMSRKVTTLAMITPHLSTFDTARGRIMNLLSNDAYIRFLEWEIYRELATQCKTPVLTPTHHSSLQLHLPARSSTKNTILSPEDEHIEHVQVQVQHELDLQEHEQQPRQRRQNRPTTSKHIDIPMRELT